MTKGEKYRAYYLANRERILDNNRERAAERREALLYATEEQLAEHRMKERERRIKARAVHYRASFEELAELCEEQWKPVYKSLASLEHLGELTPAVFGVLSVLHRAAQIGENNAAPE